MPRAIFVVATSSYTTSYNMKYNSDILRQLHVELYDILREVVRVAELCDIPYFIQGGTAMGAHFFEEIVPWDDDIDLGMTRENYERFLREAPKHLHPDYILQEFTTEENTPFYFTKIRKRGTRFVDLADICRHIPAAARTTKFDTIWNGWVNCGGYVKIM